MKEATSVDDYLSKLDTILAEKMKRIALFRNQVGEFIGKLQREQDLSRKCFEYEGEVKDAFDSLKSAEGDMSMCDLESDSDFMDAKY